MGSRGASSGVGGGKVNALPELEGSEKQIAWAQTIREEYIKEYNDYMNQLERQANGEELTRDEKIKLDTQEGLLGLKQSIGDEGKKLLGNGTELSRYKREEIEIEAGKEINDKYSSKLGFDFYVNYDPFNPDTYKNEAAFNKSNKGKKTMPRELEKQIKNEMKQLGQRKFNQFAKKFVQNRLTKNKSASFWIENHKNLSYNK